MLPVRTEDGPEGRHPTGQPESLIARLRTCEPTRILPYVLSRTFTRAAYGSDMRLMLAIFAVVLLIMIDQTQYYGHYTQVVARLIAAGLAMVGF
jgi:hypothetical protein